MHNLFFTDRVFRIAMGFILIYFSDIEVNLMFIGGIVSITTALLGFCPTYSLFGINRRFAKNNEFLKKLPKYNPEPVFIFSREGKILFQNDASKKILPDIKDFSSLSEVAPKRILENESHISIKYKLQDKTYIIEAVGIKREANIFAYGFNATQIEQSRQELKKQVVTDYLTNLGNSWSLIADFEANAEHKQVLMVVDIIKFHQINSFFGPTRGNEVLQIFAKELKKIKDNFPNIYSVYRLRGNTFGILLTCKEFKSEVFQHNMTTLQEKLSNLSQEVKIEIDGLRANINLRIGIANNDNIEFNEENKLTLMKNAEVALAEAKESGKDILFYEDISNINEKHKKNLQWASKLNDIFSNQTKAEFITYFQPIYNLKTEKIEKFESLIRIKENDDVISPFFFLDAAKQINALPKITDCVIHEACQKFQKTSYEFSINLTAQDLIKATFIKSLQEKIKKYAIEPSKVVLEILEDEDMYEHIDTISKLKEIGFKIAIDDFGVGYSNFKNLQILNVDYIKIDGSLVKNVANNEKDLSIIKSICAYAGALNIKTIAEFVADKEIFEIIKQSGVDYAQGYYIAAPSESLQEIFDAK